MRNTSKKKSSKVREAISDCNTLNNEISVAMDTISECKKLVSITPINEKNKEYLEALKKEIDYEELEIKKIVDRFKPIYNLLTSSNANNESCQDNTFLLISIGVELADLSGRLGRTMLNYSHVLEV